MNTKQIIDKIMVDKGLSLSTVAGRLGVTSACLWGRIRYQNKEMNIDKAIDVLASMDYEMVIVPRGTKLKSDWYLVEKVDDKQ